MNEEARRSVIRVKHELKITGSSTMFADNMKRIIDALEEAEAELTRLKELVFGDEVRRRESSKYPGFAHAEIILKSFQRAIKEAVEK